MRSLDALRIPFLSRDLPLMPNQNTDRNPQDSFVKKLLFLLTRKEKRQLIGVAFAVLLMGSFEVLGIASITPFIAVVADPSLISKNNYLAYVYSSLGFTSSNTFIVFIGFVVFGVIVVSNSFSAFTSWVLLGFTHQRMHSISMRLLQTYIFQSYAFFLKRNGVELQKNVLGEVNRIVGNILIPLIFIFARSVVVLMIVGLLLIVDPIPAALAFLILGGAYLLVYRFARKRLKIIGRTSIENVALRYQYSSDVLQGAKDIKLLGVEDEFLARYGLASFTASRYEALGQAISTLPRYVLEALAFGCIVGLVVYFLISGRDINSALPVIVLYAFAGYRLLPALQSIYAASAQIRFNVSALDIVWNDMRSSAPARVSSSPPLAVEDGIVVDNISFRYEGRGALALDGVSLSIPARGAIGIVGSSGAGKTTLADIILGLLAPQDGYLLVDGKPITDKNVGQWRANIGYVPQTSYLSDSSISENIAFGVPRDSINHQDVEQAARMANLHNFIVQNLPEGYSTKMGEHGVKLSGGQRQRIAIARALYRQPQFLILDEATSALDGVTESVVMEAIRGLSRKKTLLVIAHRITTLTECDNIYMLADGKVVACGSYEGLMKSNSEFRAMAKISEDVR